MKNLNYFRELTKYILVGVLFGAISLTAFTLPQINLKAVAAQSVVFSGGLISSVTIPNKAPFAGLGSFYYDVRIHDLELPTSCQVLVQTPGATNSEFTLRVCPRESRKVIQIMQFLDSIEGGVLNEITAPSSDFLLRYHRNLITKENTLEAWNIDGTLYSRSITPVLSAGAITLPQPIHFGDSTVNAKIAFFRWYSGTIALRSAPPSGSSGGNLGDWEFESNGNDSSGNNLNVAYNGVASYVSSPNYVPACNAGAPKTFKVGTTATLDGSQSFPLDGGNNLSYSWTYIPSSQPGMPVQNLTWPLGKNVVRPTITNFVGGPLNFRLTVTDSLGQSTTCNVSNGAVVTDSQDNVDISAMPAGSENIAKIIGPLTSFGSTRNVWPWFDEISKTWSDRLGGFQNTILTGGMLRGFTDSWNVAKAGTVTVANGSNIIVGSGTNFKSTFCGGGTSPISSGVLVVVWYPYNLAGSDNGTGRRGLNISECTDDTHLKINGTWRDPTGSSMNYAIMEEFEVGTWVNGSANINYYDNAIAFYSMYYRTGIDTYLQYGRWLADKWWTSPFVDRGNCNSNITVRLADNCVRPRIEAHTGLYLRALDQDLIAGSPNSSPMWPGLRIAHYKFKYDVETTDIANLVIGDIREFAYQGMYLSLCAAYDPSPEQASSCRQTINSSILNTWKKQRLPDGHWEAYAASFNSYSFGRSPAEIPTETVTVAQGSNVVTMSDGVFNPSQFSDSGNTAQFFTVKAPTDYTTRDSRFYIATYVDPTHLRLNQNYVDDCASLGGCSGRAWLASTGGAGNAWIGFGTQPFMLGIVGQFFNQAYYGLIADPAHNYDSTANLARSYLLDSAKWLLNSGTYTPSRGLYYGVGFGVCNPGTVENGCLYTGEGARALSPEALGTLALAYSVSPSQISSAAVDNLFSAVYAKNSTDPGYDGTYVSALESYYLGSNNAKWNGFFWGMGRNASWLSVRPSSVTVVVDTTPPAISSTASVVGTNSSVNISWTTDELADTQVEYGTTTIYTNLSVVNPNLSTSHVVSLSNLSGGTLYHYRVKSRDGTGNLSVSADQTFSTISILLPPTVTLTIPIGSSVVGGASLFTKLVATVGGSNISGVTFGIQTGPNVNVPSDMVNVTIPISSNSYEMNWSLNPLWTPVGNYQLFARLQDANGAMVTSIFAPIQVLASGTPVIITPILTSPAPPTQPTLLPPPVLGEGYKLTPTPTPTPQSSGGDLSSRGMSVVLPVVPTPNSSSSKMKLINKSGTYYLIDKRVRQGITNPGMLASYGFTLSQAITASQEDINLPEGNILTPQNGALVKSKEDATVYLISNHKRHSFTSASVFNNLGFKFTSVLLVTNPELQALLKETNISDSKASHLPGVDVNMDNQIYWLGGDNKLHAYPDLKTYNSWRIAGDFSRVVKGNDADKQYMIGDVVKVRELN